jgi:hypothetical protein
MAVIIPAATPNRTLIINPREDKKKNKQAAIPVIAPKTKLILSLLTGNATVDTKITVPKTKPRQGLMIMPRNAHTDKPRIVLKKNAHIFLSLFFD